MKIVYSKWYIPNECPTSYDPVFNQELIFEEFNEGAVDQFLQKIFDERYEYAYSNIYSINGILLIEISIEYECNYIKGMRFLTKYGIFKAENIGTEGKVVLEIEEDDN